MVKRRVIFHDILVFGIMSIILLLGFGQLIIPTLEAAFAENFSAEASLLLVPYRVLSAAFSPRSAMILSYILLLAYASRRFFRSSIMLYLSVFGGLLLYTYLYNIKITETVYAYPLIKIFAVPQLINTMIYAIFKAES
ncbi:MAG: hypothetical protein GX185_04770 [Tissierellia bacterium]|nr:hypothetical protein [Tissierellia bacterium]